MMAACCGTVAIVGGPAAFAQTTSSLDRVEVTGSAIRRVDAETALPVTVMKMDEMKAEGYTTVEQVVQSLSVNQSLQGTSQSVGLTTGGASFANLRGLGQNKTLVLLNGRRIANNAFDSSAPDLNMIPIAAIDRIEVLRDGASSLYGTDAIGGVINFITKKNYQGGEITLGLDHPQHSGGKSQSANVGFGRGDLNKDGWNVFGFLDYQHQDVLSTPQRPDFATSTKTSPTGFPGSYSQGGASYSPFAPDCAQPFQAKAGTTCKYYYWNWVDLVPKTDRLSGMLKGTIKLAGDNLLGLEYFASQNTVETNIAPVPFGALHVDPGTKYYPGNGVTPPPPAGSGIDPTKSIKVRWRDVPNGPRADKSENTQQRLVASLEGSWGKWDYGTGLSWNQNKVNYSITGGYTNGDIITAAVKNGTVNPFSPTQDAAGQAILNSANVTGDMLVAKGDVWSWDAKGSRELGDWFHAGRSTALAIGGEIRHESFSEVAANPALAQQVISSTGIDPATSLVGSRTVAAIYGELNMPITKAFEVTASIRHDRYSDFGSTTNPKLSARFQPSKTWLLRGAVSTGFRAPSLYDMHAAQTFTNTANNWNDPVRCPGGNPIPGASSSDNCGVQFMSLTGGNPHLQPEKSKTATFGFVVQPVPEFDASVDFWWIKLKQQIAPLQDTTVFGDPTKYASKFVRAPDGTLATDGSLCNTAANPGPQCGYVLLLTDNLGGVNTNGVDITAAYRLRTSYGNWTFRALETYVSKYEYQNEENGPWIQNVGIYSGAGPVFRNQYTLSATWTNGKWTAGLANHYKAGYIDEDGTSNVGAYSTWDLYGSWTPVKQFTLTAGVRNLLDTKPPTSVQSATFQVGYDPRFADPFMRVYYLRGTYRF